MRQQINHRLFCRENRARKVITINTAASQGTSASAWSPLRIPLFRALWLATLASNIGTWMHEIGAGWLMTSLSPTPVMVALVQTATTLPIFLLAIPAGALADIIDRRRYLLAVQCWLAATTCLLGVLTVTGITTAWILVLLTFAMGIGSAMMWPAWAAVTPEVVPRSELQPAIALNSMGMNVARAVGPALAGIIVSMAGSGPVFLLNAVSYLGVMTVLWRWQRQAPRSKLPGERWFGAMRAGLRFARNEPLLKAAMFRGAGFFVFASASWALLPLLSRNLVGGGPQTFGLLVASIGAGAVAGAFLLPRLRRRLSRDWLVAAGSLLYAAALFALSTLHQLWPLCLAMAASGLAWIAILSTLQVTAQMALPDWVRSRGLAVFMMVFMGSMALGSLMWGRVAQSTSIEQALLTASVGAVLAVALTWRWSLGDDGRNNPAPSVQWPTPLVHDAITNDRGPVLVTAEYAVQAGKEKEFLTTMRQVAGHRRRNGGFNWGVFEHAEKPHYYIETFQVESWLEHLRQHERVPAELQSLQAHLKTLLLADTKTRVTHYVSPKTLNDNKTGQA